MDLADLAQIEINKVLEKVPEIKKCSQKVLKIIKQNDYEVLGFIYFFNWGKLSLKVCFDL